MSDPIDLGAAPIEISDEGLQEMIRQVIWHGMPADIKERAVGWFDKISDLLYGCAPKCRNYSTHLN
jgi:hypothetical protein